MACLWYGEFVPSLTVTAFDFYLNHAIWQHDVPYEGNGIVTVSCTGNSSVALGVGDPNGGGEITAITTSLPALQCGVLYTFFVARKADTQGQNGNPNTPNYQIITSALITAPAGNWVPGYVFNMIYNRGAINVAYCDGNRSPCDRNQGRTNEAISQATAQQIELQYKNGFQNPVTVSNLWDQTVTNDATTYSYWVFYGDNNNQGQFPIRGSSSASFVGASMTLVIALTLLLSSVF